MWQAVQNRVAIAKHFFIDLGLLAGARRVAGRSPVSMFQDKLNEISTATNLTDYNRRFAQMQRLPYATDPLTRPHVLLLFPELENDVANRRLLYKAEVNKLYGKPDIAKYLDYKEAQINAVFDTATEKTIASVYSIVYLLLLCDSLSDNTNPDNVAIKASAFNRLYSLITVNPSATNIISNTAFALFKQASQLERKNDAFVLYVLYVLAHRNVNEDVGQNIDAIVRQMAFGCKHPQICREWMTTSLFDQYRDIIRSFQASMAADLDIPYFSDLFRTFPTTEVDLANLTDDKCSNIWITLVFLQGVRITDHGPAAGIAYDATRFDTYFQNGLLYATLCMYLMQIKVVWPDQKKGNNVVFTYLVPVAKLLERRFALNERSVKRAFASIAVDPEDIGVINSQRTKVFSTVLNTVSTTDPIEPEYKVDEYIDGMIVPAGNTEHLIKLFSTWPDFTEKADPNTVVGLSFVIPMTFAMIHDLKALANGSKLKATIVKAIRHFCEKMKNQVIFCRTLLEVIRRFRASTYYSLAEEYRGYDGAHLNVELAIEMYGKLEKDNKAIEGYYDKSKIDYSGVIMIAYYCDMYFPQFHEFLQRQLYT
jgi:hypothetical protein